MRFEDGGDITPIDGKEGPRVVVPDTKGRGSGLGEGRRKSTTLKIEG